MRVDPVGLNGGVNLYVYVRCNPINRTDRLGLLLAVLSYGELDDVYGQTQLQSYFMKWYNYNRENKDWLNTIPKCPDKISLCDKKPVNCDNGEWGDIGRANVDYHPGATWCMRSKANFGSAQQCCYDDDGMLLKKEDGIAAGTPDRQAASPFNFLGIPHYLNDVEAFNIAMELDGGLKGRYLELYLEVRPPSEGGGSCYK